MSMTYNSLVSQITSYLNTTNAETIAQIPNFIYLTHNEICRKFVNLGYEQYVNGTFIANAINGGSVLPKPSRWRANISFSYGSSPALISPSSIFIPLRTYEYCRTYNPDPSVSGAPQFYSDYGYQNWLVVPTPNLAYPFQIAYLEMPVPINVNLQTNWLTNYAPDALLWGSLCKAIPFLKDDERVPLWQAYYKDACDSLEAQDRRNYQDRISKRMAD